MRSRWVIQASFAAPLFVAVAVWAGIPEPDEYRGREVAQTMSWQGAPWLVRPNRQAEEDAAALLDILALQPGQTACDIGVGVGYHAVPMAEAVGPTGTVYGVDIQPEMLAGLADRATQAGVTNVVGVLGTVRDVALPPGACDAMLVVDAYHEFSDPAAMLAGMRRALAPAGRLVVVEYREEDPSVPIKPRHKMTKERVVLEIGSPDVGLRLIDQDDRLPWQHVLVFGRTDGPHPAVAVEAWRPDSR